MWLSSGLVGLESNNKEKCPWLETGDLLAVLKDSYISILGLFCASLCYREVGGGQRAVCLWTRGFGRHVK